MHKLNTCSVNQIEKENGQLDTFILLVHYNFKHGCIMKAYCYSYLVETIKCLSLLYAAHCAVPLQRLTFYKYIHIYIL